MRRILLFAMLILITGMASAQNKFDLNNDGSVTTADVPLLVNFLLGNDTPSQTYDLNKDGKVSVADITKLVNIALGIETLPPTTLDTPEEVNARLFNNSIYISWTPVPYAESYRVYRSGDGTVYTLLARDLTTTAYTDASPLPGRNYYRVKAFGENLESAFSEPTSPVFYDEGNGLLTGLYMGIIGFNDNLHDKGPMRPLAPNTKSSFTNFVDNLTTTAGTLLYYAVDSALVKLTSTPYPNNLTNVVIVTFTDGLDQGSCIKSGWKYWDEDEYLEGLASEIHNTRIQGLNLDSYTIGLRGGDVTSASYEDFKANLRELASSEDKSKEVVGMTELDTQFRQIAQNLTEVTKMQTLKIKFPIKGRETLFRFTFDNVSDPSQSQCYIEGTLDGQTFMMTDISYVGVKCSSGVSIQGTYDGNIMVELTFDDVKKADGTTLSLNYLNEYYWRKTYWQVNSEFNKDNDVEVSVSHTSAAVMLVLDSSSSLNKILEGSGDTQTMFVRMKTAAKNFIATLAAAMDPVYMVNYITLSQGSLILDLSATTQLSATVNPAYATNGSVAWTSSDTSVATVDQNGLVSAIAVGRCIITCTAKDGSGMSASCSVRVARLVTSITLNETSLSLNSGDTHTLTATVSPSDATDKGITWSSSNTGVATVDANGLVTAIAAGTCTITATAKDGSGVVATCVVTVHAYVDLGLPSGTLWATCNIGANKPTNYGYYFAWGETVPYGQEDTGNAHNYSTTGSYIKTTFNWGTYKYCSGTDRNTLMKYCNDSSCGYNGFTDTLTELELEDDAAYVNWGSGWRMPSKEQFDELLNSSYTTTEWTYQGRKITSKSNGNSIFLPAAGYRGGTSLYDDGLYGNYWSRTLRTSTPYYAFHLYDNNSYIYAGYGNRCSGRSVRPVRRNDITLSQSSLSLTVGNSQNLAATNASIMDVAWTTSNQNVATVSQTGIVTAVGVGTCTITCSATDGSNQTATCCVTVTPQLVTGITLSQSSLSLTTGNSQTLTATVLPSNASNKNVTWTSSITNVATVSQTGIVTAVGVGTCTITCSSTDGSNHTATCCVTVTQLVTGITLSQSSLSLTIGDSQTLTATIQPSNASNKNVTWTSSNQSVATVSQTGMVTAVGVGTCTITCAAVDDSGQTATCSVTVIPQLVTGITLSQSSLSLPIGDSQTLMATVLPSNSTNKNVTWTSSNQNVATVSQTGVVTAVGAGTCTITCAATDSSGKTATCCVTVTDFDTDDPIEYGDISGKTLSIGVALATFQPNTWYFLHQARHFYSNGDPYCALGEVPTQGGFMTDMGIGSNVCKQSVSDIVPGCSAESVAAYLVSFVPTERDGVYNIKFGTGNWLEAPMGTGNSKRFTTTSNKSLAGLYNVYTIDNNSPGYFALNVSDSRGDYQELVDNEGVGNVIVTWESGRKTTLSGNNVWSIIEVNWDGENTVMPDGSDTHTYVDLGLPSGTLWATCNIGADNPEDYGDYFAWGETMGYTGNTSDGRSFNWTSYKYCKGSNTTLTKYCNKSSYGYNSFTDNLTELLPVDDAAYVNWGSGWRMPSKTQFDELINSSYTTTTWTTQNGVNGYQITSKTNGNSIFFPAAGYRNGSSRSSAGSYGYYWSRTLYTSYPNRAYDLYFYLGGINWGNDYRCNGQSVRPVCVPQ